MSLHFDSSASTTAVDFPSAASLDNHTTFTHVLWFKPTQAPHSGNILLATKGGAPFNGGSFLMTSSNASYNYRLVIDRASANAFAEGTAPLTTNAWTFLAATYDEAVGAKLYHGTLSVPVTEQTYNGNSAGSGATAADSANALRLGNTNSSPSSSNGFRGDIARYAYYSSVLSLSDLRGLQYGPTGSWNLSTCELLVDVGLHGVGTQIDYSGNLHTGTVSNATQANPAPIIYTPQSFNYVPYEVPVLPAGYPITHVVGV